MFNRLFSRQVVIRDYCGDEWWAREVKNDPEMMKYSRKQRANYYKKQAKGVSEAMEVINFEVALHHLGSQTGMYHFSNNQGKTVCIPVIISQMKAAGSDNPLLKWYNAGIKASNDLQIYGTTRPSPLMRVRRWLGQMMTR